jgi:hydrogenase nickel incorporation protein HypB
MQRRLSTAGKTTMCDTCGCNVTAGNVHLLDDMPAHGGAIEVLQNLLTANDLQARHNREHFDEHGVLALNLMASPGAGKTALLEATIDALRDEFNIAVIEGDLETENDAARIRAHGVPAIQITTGTACHLDAHLLHRALHDLPLAGLDLVFIENVGNLVCPASFDLGQHRNVTLLSVTEGDDKPAKYPVMFRAADLVLLSKCDLLTVLDDFEPARAESALRALGRDTPVIRVAARRQKDIAGWLAWLRSELLERRRPQTELAPGTVRPARTHAEPEAHAHSPASLPA